MSPKSVALLASLMVPVGHAADVVWTNTAGGYWNVAANWSPNQVPGAADTAIITADGTYAVTLNVNAAIAGLRVGGNSIHVGTLTACDCRRGGSCWRAQR